MNLFVVFFGRSSVESFPRRVNFGMGVSQSKGTSMCASDRRASLTFSCCSSIWIVPSVGLIVRNKTFYSGNLNVFETRFEQQGHNVILFVAEPP